MVNQNDNEKRKAYDSENIVFDKETMESKGKKVKNDHEFSDLKVQSVPLRGMGHGPF
jgi:hypothetical protein